MEDSVKGVASLPLKEILRINDLCLKNKLEPFTIKGKKYFILGPNGLIGANSREDFISGVKTPIFRKLNIEVRKISDKIKK